MVLALGNTPNPAQPLSKSFQKSAPRQNAATKIAFQLFPPPPWSPFWNWKFSSRSPCSPPPPVHTHTTARPQCAQWRHGVWDVSVYWWSSSSGSDFPFPIRRVRIGRVQYLRGGVFPTLIVAVTCTRWLASFVWKLFLKENSALEWSGKCRFRRWWRETGLCLGSLRGEDKLWWSNRT